MNFDTGTGFVCAPSCGDILRLHINVDDEGFIDNLQCKTFGCEATECIEERFMLFEGMSIDEAMMVDMEEMTEDLDEDGHIGILMLNGIHSAIMDYAEKKHGAHNDKME